jgi:cytoskeletal protein CcmA (bactofilin family)
VVIAREGELVASVRVNHITIGGRFEGDVEARGQLIILATGTCSGKVVCHDFVVEPGGILDADVVCTAGSARKPSDNP